MRRDRELLARADRTQGFEPVLRLFRFDPHGITLGYAQRAERELDLERCERDGIAWAVRPTGGRAIFHAEEWTYSLTARLDDPRWGGSLSDAYGAIARLLVASLVHLGVPAAHANGSARRAAQDPSGAQHPSPASPACFGSTARHEIVLQGRKLVGSAQRRTARALLQQGSLLLGSGHLRLADYLRRDDAQRAAERQRLSASAIDAGALLGSSAPLERWADALAQELGADARRTHECEV